MSLLQRIARRLGQDRFLKLLGLYPPYLGAGVSVTHVAADLSVVEVELKLSAWNRNFVGTQFGGSLYSMCDPFFMLMLMMQLGEGYLVWDKSHGARRARRTGRPRAEDPERAPEGNRPGSGLIAADCKFVGAARIG